MTAGTRGLLPPGRLRELDARRPYKPLDVGEAGIAATIDWRGRLVLLTEPHPVHGMVTLTATPRLRPGARFDGSAVRRYRGRLSSPGAAAAGLRWADTSVATVRRVDVGAWLLADAVPVTSVPGGRGSIVTLVPHPDDVDGARGLLQLLPPGTQPPMAWEGRVRLGRAEYPELTEANPLPPARSRPGARLETGALVLEDPELGWAVAIAAPGLGVGSAVARRGWLDVDVPARGRVELVALGTGRDGEEAGRHARTLASIDADRVLRSTVARWERRWTGWPSLPSNLDLVARRGASYVISCCAIPVGDATCLVTDHVLLPLAWTRDGYFLARALLDWPGAEADTRAVVRRHLTWLFEVADRPDGWWARSHLVGGQRKDPGFQLDQQLYPLLELVDYVDATGDRDPIDRYGNEIGRVLAAIDERRAPGATLFATDETPADDRLVMPYQTPNQILAWHAFRELDRLGFGNGRLAEQAAAVRRSIGAHQVVDLPPNGAMYAYATDLAGGRIVYQDANDLPLAMAPQWGFCSPDDPVWRATIAFAFSPRNPGFFPGPHGGLGSAHTPAPWPLGYVQEALAGRIAGEAGWWDRALSRITECALWDGSLPEASDADTARLVSRPWFGWPGAVTLSTLLADTNRRDPA